MAGSGKNKKGARAGDPDRARVLNRIIFGIALFGAVLTVHLWIQSERGFSRGCFGFSEPDEVGIVECAAVVQSDAGKLFGISNIVYGFLFFGVIAALSFGTVLAKEERARQLKLVGFIMAAAGILYALYLFSYQVFVLGEFCQLCLTTALTTAVLFGVFVVYRSQGAVPGFDLAGLVREIGWFLLMTLVAGLLLVSDVFFLNRIGTLETATAEVSEMHDDGLTGVSEAPGEMSHEDSLAFQAQLASLCRFDDSTPTLADFDRIISGTPLIGDPDAPIRMVEFFDPNCPHCKSLHEAIPKLLEAVGDRASLHFKPFPLWPFSYQQIEALYLAEDAGKFNEMMDLQMRRQKRGGLSVGELTDMAEEIGMDRDGFRRDLNGGKYRSRVNRDRVQVQRAGISSVPKIAIEGRFVTSRSLVPPCMDYLVDQAVAAG